MSCCQPGWQEFKEGWGEGTEAQRHWGAGGGGRGDGDA